MIGRRGESRGAFLLYRKVESRRVVANNSRVAWRIAYVRSRDADVWARSEESRDFPRWESMTVEEPVAVAVSRSED